MTVERRIASLFRVDDEAWQRHVNPWSVVLRTTALPLLILAFWSRAWLGWWAAVPVAVALLWIWLNPRVFRPPRPFDHRTSKSVLGERVWLNRDTVQVPAHHRTVTNVLSAVGGIGVLFVAWGVLALEAWPTLFGAALVYLGQALVPRPHGLARARHAGRGGRVPILDRHPGRGTNVQAVRTGCAVPMACEPGRHPVDIARKPGRSSTGSPSSVGPRS